MMRYIELFEQNEVDLNDEIIYNGAADTLAYIAKLKAAKVRMAKMTAKTEEAEMKLNRKMQEAAEEKASNILYYEEDKERVLRTIKDMGHIGLPPVGVFNRIGGNLKQIKRAIKDLVDEDMLMRKRDSSNAKPWYVAVGHD